MKSDKLLGEISITESFVGLSSKIQEGQIKCPGYLHRKQRSNTVAVCKSIPILWLPQSWSIFLNPIYTFELF